MKGTIRTKERCPICNALFVHLPRVGLRCKRHLKERPGRLFIDLFWRSQRIKIYSDQDGLPLDSYSRVFKLQAQINREIEKHIFDPTKYVRLEVEKFWTMTLLDRFWEKKNDSIAPSYQSHYKRMVERAKEFFGTKDVRDIMKLDLINYKDHLEKKVSFPSPKNKPKEHIPLSPKTIKNNLFLFKTFLHWCKNDLAILSSVPNFPQVEVSEPKFKWLPQQDQIKLFQFVADSDKPIIGFLMLHGCRPSEARALKCKDVDLATGTITIRGTFSGRVYREKRKGRGARAVTIPIHPELEEYIVERVRGNLPDAFLFPNPRTGTHYSACAILRVWNGVRKRAEIGSDLRLYDATRHSFASQLVNLGTSIFKVSKLLGHSSVKMTEKYSHSSIDHLKTDIQKLSLKKIFTVPRPSPEPKIAEFNLIKSNS